MNFKKSILLTTLFFLGLNLAAQDNFVFNQGGLYPKYVVVEIDSLDQNEIFKKTINWIKETYKNPDEVIKTTIDNEKVRFEGFIENLICISGIGIVCYNGLYTIEIEFKDDKYKITPLSVQYRNPANMSYSDGLIPIDLNDGSGFYNKKGELIKFSKTIPSSIESLFNELNYNLMEYLLSKQQRNTDSDW